MREFSSRWTWASRRRPRSVPAPCRPCSPRSSAITPMRGRGHGPHRRDDEQPLERSEVALGRGLGIGIRRLRGGRARWGGRCGGLHVRQPPEVLLPGGGDRRRGHVDEDRRSSARCGAARGQHVRLLRQPVALAPVARRAAGDDVVPGRRAALRARDHVVDGEGAALVAAVLAGPAVAREDRAAGDLAAVRVARDAHVGESRITTGRGSVRLSAWSAQSPCSRTSARSFRTSTAARRTVQTLIGSNEALSTSTRPDDVPRCQAGRRRAARRVGPGSESPASADGTFALHCHGARQCSQARGPPDTSRAPAAPRRAPRSASSASPTGASAGAALEVGEEHVVAEPHPPRPRLDLRQVHVAVRELAQHLHEPARRLVADAPEDDRGLGAGSPGSSPRRRARARRSASRCPGGPRRRRRARAAVELGRQPRAERAPTARPASATSAPPRRWRARARARRRRAARAGSARTGRWPAGARPPASTSSSGSSRAAIRQWWIGWTTSADDPHAGRPRRRARRAWRPPPPSSEFSIGTTARSTLAVLHGHHRLVDRRVGELLDARRGRRAQRLLAERAGGPEETRPAGQAPRGRARPAPSRPPRCSSGESSSSESPSCSCLT